MKKNILLFSAFTATAIITIVSCSKVAPTNSQAVNLVLPETPYNYTADNKLVNNDKATLGRVLFYDKKLSLNNSVSCGTCHKQSAAFADNEALSSGLNNKKTTRNTPSIQNLSLHNLEAIILSSGNNNNTIPNQNGTINGNIQNVPEFQPLFWDARESDLQTLMLQPIVNHIEMGFTNIDEVVAKLNSEPYYKPLVEKAFGTPTLTKTNLSDALAHFTASIRTVNTKFDKVVASQLDINSLLPLELIGFQLFSSAQYNCSGCHASIVAGPVVQQGGSAYGGSSSNNSGSPSIDIATFSANIGLDENSTDGGMGALTNQSALNGRFRTPDLHNVALTAPYMHDGRFATLDQVVGHYSHNIVGSGSLDSRLQNANGSAKQLNISEFDKKAIVAFLQTLTSKEVTTDVKLSNPFVAVK